jgi:cation diffusion facilitator family transporter
MTQFPEPISLPPNVPEDRKKRDEQVMRAGIVGIFIRTFIIAFELLGVLFFGSSALLMDAIASSVDVFSSIFLLIFIKIASKPPDENHPFGHGRLEPLAGLQLALLMFVFGGFMIFQQAFSIADSSHGGEIESKLWIIPLIAVILLEISYQTIMRVAKKRHSPALAADGIHYRIDALTSLLATIVLILASIFPTLSHSIDHWGALFIAILMMSIGIFAAKSNLNQLMDHVPDPDFFDKVKSAAKRVKGVSDTEKIRIQLYGPNAHVDIDIEVDPSLPVEEAHLISQKVRAEIQKEWPAVLDVTVHIEPYYPHDH